MEAAGAKYKAKSLRRLPFLDDLRFFCTILMVAYHASASFTNRATPIWPAHDIYGNLVFDYLALTLRWSRMPIVFFVSGLSAGLLLRKGNASYFINRLRRIYLPLMLAAIVFLPQVAAIYLMRERQCTTLDCFWQTLTSGDCLQASWRIAPAHLWYLFYLLPLYLIPPSVPAVVADRVRGVLARVLSHPAKPLIFAPLTFLLLYPMKDWLFLDIAIFEFFPRPELFLYYAVFFVLGWAVSLDTALLEKFRANRKIYFSYMLVSSVLLLYCLMTMRRPDLVDQTRALPKLLLFTNNLFSWVSLFFWIGLFIDLSRRAHRFFKYVDGSAYWVYLSHYSLVMLIQVLLENEPLNVYLKFTLAFGGTLGICTLTWWLYARAKRAVSAATA